MTIFKVFIMVDFVTFLVDDTTPVLSSTVLVVVSFVTTGTLKTGGTTIGGDSRPKPPIFLVPVCFSKTFAVVVEIARRQNEASKRNLVSGPA